jgi:hypothetical protein
MLRYKEPTGWRFPLSDFKDDVVKMARANPLDARTVDGMAAKGYYESMYGLGRTERMQTFTALAKAEMYNLPWRR